MKRRNRAAANPWAVRDRAVDLVRRLRLTEEKPDILCPTAREWLQILPDEEAIGAHVLGCEQCMALMLSAYMRQLVEIRKGLAGAGLMVQVQSHQA